jgi:hypothetical protein
MDALIRDPVLILCLLILGALGAESLAILLAEWLRDL